jgi:hypothetical protein
MRAHRLLIGRTSYLGNQLSRVSNSRSLRIGENSCWSHNLGWRGEITCLTRTDQPTPDRISAASAGVNGRFVRSLEIEWRFLHQLGAWNDGSSHGPRFGRTEQQKPGSLVTLTRITLTGRRVFAGRALRLPMEASSATGLKAAPGIDSYGRLGRSAEVPQGAFAGPRQQHAARAASRTGLAV